MTFALAERLPTLRLARYIILAHFAFYVCKQARVCTYECTCLPPIVLGDLVACDVCTIPVRVSVKSLLDGSSFGSRASCRDKFSGECMRVQDRAENQG